MAPGPSRLMWKAWWVAPPSSPTKGGAAGGDTMTLSSRRCAPSTWKTSRGAQHVRAPMCAGGFARVRRVPPGHCQQDRDQKERSATWAPAWLRLRDAAGQAREYHNYMLPVDTGDGVPVFLLGVREAPSEPFRYLRVPPMTRAAWMALCACGAALADPAARDRLCAAMWRRPSTLAA